MIHSAKLPQIMERKGKDNKPVPFSFKYVKKSTGQIIHVQNAVLTSSYHRGTINIKILHSAQVRTISLPLIIEFNNTKVYL